MAETSFLDQVAKIPSRSRHCPTEHGPRLDTLPAEERARKKLDMDAAIGQDKKNPPSGLTQEMRMNLIIATKSPIARGSRLSYSQRRAMYLKQFDLVYVELMKVAIDKNGKYFLTCKFNFQL